MVFIALSAPEPVSQARNAGFNSISNSRLEEVLVNLGHILQNLLAAPYISNPKGSFEESRLREFVVQL